MSINNNIIKFNKLKSDWLDLIQTNSNIKFILSKINKKKEELIISIYKILKYEDYFEKSIIENIIKLKTILNKELNKELNNENIVLNKVDDFDKISNDKLCDCNNDSTCEDCNEDNIIHNKITKLFNQFKTQINDINIMTIQVDNFNDSFIFNNELLLQNIENFIKNSLLDFDNSLIIYVNKMKRYLNKYIFIKDNLNDDDLDDFSEDYINKLLENNKN